MGEYQHLYPETVRRYDRPIGKASPSDAVMDTAQQVEKPLPKVAQKQKYPTSKKPSDKKDGKITVDNGRPAAYIDIQDKLASLSEDERAIATLIGSDGILVDALIAKAGIPAGKVLSALTMLEIKGVVCRLPGKRVVLRK